MVKNFMTNSISGFFDLFPNVSEECAAGLTA
jgi:hypothetical protein